MLRTLILAAGTSLVLATGAVAATDPIAAAVADAHRPANDKALDGDRKPADMLKFAGVKPGDTVVDLMPGGGYFTRLFSKAVGPTGHVYAYHPAEEDKFFKDKPPPVNAIASDPAYANVTVIHKPIDDFAIPTKADIVWTSQNYHDLHDPWMGPANVPKLDKAIYDALKPGGTFIVLDHAAEAGSGLRDTNTLHRIDPAIVKTEVTAAGFTFTGEDDSLKNSADDHTLKVFDPKIRHKTDQFIFKFTKP